MRGGRRFAFRSIVQLTVNIIVLGSIYALIACGYVLIYRVSRVLNLAHGELMMLGAYLVLATASLFSGQPVLALLAPPVLAECVLDQHLPRALDQPAARGLQAVEIKHERARPLHRDLELALDPHHGARGLRTLHNQARRRGRGGADVRPPRGGGNHPHQQQEDHRGMLPS
jgi:hypothetical protein